MKCVCMWYNMFILFTKYVFAAVTMCIKKILSQQCLWNQSINYSNENVYNTSGIINYIVWVMQSHSEWLRILVNVSILYFLVFCLVLRGMSIWIFFMGLVLLVLCWHPSWISWERFIGIMLLFTKKGWQILFMGLMTVHQNWRPSAQIS